MEAEQYTSDAGLWLDTDGEVNAHANPPGTPANAIVGILYERSDRQTLNSYARLIWVRHLHPIPGNCQSLQRLGKTRLSSHFRTPTLGLRLVNIQLFTKSIVGKGAKGRAVSSPLKMPTWASGQRFKQRINVLQNLRVALLAPIQGNHLLVGLDFVDIGRQR